VDDGSDYPADVSSLVDGPSVRVLSVAPGTPLGIKLNHGVHAARGQLCMKMDDDDWYAPTYLETSMDALRATQQVVCRPTIVMHMGFLFFDLQTWSVRESTERNAPGATLLFSRSDWQRRPFRPVPTDEDAWFYRDQMKAGATVLTVNSKETFVAIRHRGHQGTFGHTWNYQLDGSTLEDYLGSRPTYSKPPEQLFPDWALEVYRSIHEELAAARVDARGEHGPVEAR
jgi:glycosyltransferase involved in cell wall biosynthesis